MKHIGGLLMAFIRLNPSVIGIPAWNMTCHGFGRTVSELARTWFCLDFPTCFKSCLPFNHHQLLQITLFDFEFSSQIGHDAFEDAATASGQVVTVDISCVPEHDGGSKSVCKTSNSASVLLITPLAKRCFHHVLFISRLLANQNFPKSPAS